MNGLVSRNQASPAAAISAAAAKSSSAFQPTTRSIRRSIEDGAGICYLRLH